MFSLSNTTRSATPTIPFEDMKNAVLGKRYDLSLALISEAAARRITRQTKGKDKASDVLSFPLSPDSGEIVLCLGTARAEYRAHGYSDARTFLAHLFIHGLLHLKGFAHSDTMDATENKVAARFGL